MATADKPRKDPRPACEDCSNAQAVTTDEVRLDHVTHKYLCNECWADVNPRNFGVPDPQWLPPSERATGL